MRWTTSKGKEEDGFVTGGVLVKESKQVNSRIVWMKVELVNESSIFVTVFIPGVGKTREEKNKIWKLF